MASYFLTALMSLCVDECVFAHVGSRHALYGQKEMKRGLILSPDHSAIKAHYSSLSPLPLCLVHMRLLLILFNQPQLILNVINLTSPLCCIDWLHRFLLLSFLFFFYPRPSLNSINSWLSLYIFFIFYFCFFSFIFSDRLYKFISRAWVKLVPRLKVVKGFCNL